MSPTLLEKPKINTIDFKEKAAFAEENEALIRGIIQSKGDTALLAQLPPYFMVLDLTWKCNLQCVGCVEQGSINRRGIQDLSLELIDDLFDYSHLHGVQGIMTMGGEVFVYSKGIDKAMEKSLEYGIPLKTVTNGTLLAPHAEKIRRAYSLSGSMLRISLNAGRKNYSRQVGREYISFDQILNTINLIASDDINLFASTVVFPKSSAESGFIPNIEDLEEIVGDAREAGIKTHIVLAARDPETKSRFKYTEEEKAEFERVADKYDHLYVKDVSGRGKRIKLDSLPHPCPSNFLFTLIGSDGKLYKCTDNRGRDYAVIGQIFERGDFERVWHSEERVMAQLSAQCVNKGCIRSKVNAIIDNAQQMYSEYGIDLTDYLLQKREVGGEKPIFI